MPLRLAGPIWYTHGSREFFEKEIAPRIVGVQFTYLGEVGGDDRARLYSEARAILAPTTQEEPFGLVTAEALACGTPVITFNGGGAAREIVLPESTDS